jgi:hypothetical protein
MRAGSQMLDEPGIGRGTDTPQEDEVKVVLICNDLEVIARYNPPAGPDGFGYYKLAALAHIRRHAV